MAMDEALKLYLKSQGERLGRIEDTLDRMETVLHSRIETVSRDMTAMKEFKAETIATLEKVISLDQDVLKIKVDDASTNGKMIALSFVFGIAAQIAVAVAPYIYQAIVGHN